MLTEEKPEAFATPEQNHENGSKKKKKKKKKKNNETLPQSIEHPQSQVSSDPLVVTPISEFKSNEKACEEFANTQTAEIKKKKKKKKNVINGEESNDPKPSLDALGPTEFENKKEVEKSEVYAEFAKTQTSEKRKRKSKSETGKMGEVVVVENLLNHDSEQVNEIDRRKRQNSVQDGGQSNEHNVEPAETAVPISVVDRELSSVDSTIRLNNQANNEHNVEPAETAIQVSVVDREVSQVNSESLVVTPISEFKSNEEAHAEFARTQTGEIKKKKKKNKKSVINGEESNEPKPSLDVTLSTEFEIKKEVEKSEVYAEFAKTQTGEIKKKKKKKKSVINGEESNEPKPSLESMGSTEFENKKEVEKSEVYAEFAKTQTGEKGKRKSKSETGKMSEVVVLENVLNHDSEQVNEIDRRKRQKSVQDGAQSNEDNVEPAEIAVQISVVDRELSSVDPTIRLNNQPANLVEQKDVRKTRQEKHLELMKMQSIIAKDERKKRQEKHLEITKIAKEKRKIRQEKHLELMKMRKIAKEERKRLTKKRVSDESNKMQAESKYELKSTGDQSKEHNAEPAKTAVQISVVDREVSLVDPTMRLNNQPNNEHSVEPAETSVQISVLDREASQVNSEPLVVTPISEFKSNEEACAEFANTQTGDIKKKNKKKKSAINGEESNEPKSSLDVTVSTEFENKKEVEKSEVYAEFAKTQTGEIKKKKKKKKSVINGEESNEPKSSFDATVSTEFENKKEVEKSEVYAEFVKTQTGEIKKKKKKKKSVINGEESNEPKPSLDATVTTEFENKKEGGKSEVYAEFVKTQTGEIKKKKKKKKSVINGEESNEPKPSLDATVTTEFENKKEGGKSEVYAEFGKTQSAKKRRRKSKSETGKMGEVVVVENVLSHDSEQVNEIDRRKRQKSVQEGAQSNEDNVEPAETAVQMSVVDRELSPVDPTIRLNNQPANLVEQKDERKRLKKISVMDEINKDKMQVKRKYELRSRGEEKTNSGICWACREPNHSIKQCRKLKSLSKDEEICFFCGEIGHSLGKCSVYIAGGGRLARCLFCNLHGHFSFNCPGHGHFQGAVAGGS
ncbi:titin homolog [Trifolium pratense]|uniref:titin homolog n=1 Tax=Trifolium pratense TaxID=57577 RepID=UPI001E6932FC|nr:titin homolog [Trifolium pratense]